MYYTIHISILCLGACVFALLGMMAMAIFVAAGNEPDPWDLEDDDHDDQGSEFLTKPDGEKYERVTE